jgi:hypothetical protein
MLGIYAHTLHGHVSAYNIHDRYFLNIPNVDGHMYYEYYVQSCELHSPSLWLAGGVYRYY